MSSLLRLKGQVFVLTLAALLAGCRSEFDHRAVDLDDEFARASNLGQPMIVLVTESGASRADDRARSLFQTMAAKGESEKFAPIVLDLSVSRNRAVAARFHVTNTPLLLGLTPRGLIVTRDEKPITKSLLLHRIAEVARRGDELDARLASLEDAAARDRNDATAQWQLANFLLAQQNMREAIPILRLIARAESADTALRVRAWVELARAHLWIAEPEKGRHEAEDLIAVLGPKAPAARAGGNLVLGVQDANAKHLALARRELQAAIAAAPESDYANQAEETLAKIPGEGK